MSARELPELAAGFNQELAPAILELNEQIHGLSGTMAEQYVQWRRILRQLFELYGAAMRASPLSATFDYIAKPSEGAGFDAGSIQKQIADVDQFQAFMKNYRERLLKSKGKPKDQTGTKSAQSDPSTTG